jgi:osmotically-inducible protein OsmY
MRTAPAQDEPGAVLERIRKTLERDRRVKARAHPLTLSLEDGTLVIDGEVADLPAKTRAVELARSFPEVQRVVDRMLIEAPVRTPDGELRDLYRDALLGELCFEHCRLVVNAQGVSICINDPEHPRGELVATIASGVAKLEGKMPSLAHVRLAGVLAWWIPGMRNVVNELRVEPPEEDCDEELTDAIRVALEKEPLLDAAQIGVRSSAGRVTLYGTLRSERQRELAETDAWYVLGVRDVDNQIEVQR